MSDLSFLTDQLARQQIAERHRAARLGRLPGPPRPRGRHAVAARLHRLANRLDG